MRLALALAAAAVLAALCLSAGADAAANPQEMLIYMPYGLIHSVHPASEVDEYLAEASSYDIGQVVFAMPRLKSSGTLKVPKHNAQMLALYASQEAAYNAEHGTDLTLTAVFPGKVGAKNGLDLEDAGTRANILAAVESSLGLEPYPTTPGFLTLLEQIDAMFARVGFNGRLSVTAPATVSRWTSSYIEDVSQLVAQLDPLYYDSESKTVAAYQQWVDSGLAHYSASASPSTRIVPVLPSYSADPWHIWSGWGFLMDEEGAYEGSEDRASWLSSTIGLPFSP
jgi:hypothetical protein